MANHRPGQNVFVVFGRLAAKRDSFERQAHAWRVRHRDRPIGGPLRVKAEMSSSAFEQPRMAPNESRRQSDIPRVEAYEARDLGSGAERWIPTY